MHFSLFSSFSIWTLSYLLLGLHFWFALCNLLMINLWSLWLFRYRSCILWYFLNNKWFMYVLQILSWPPFTEVQFTKWKWYRWYWYLIAWRHEVHLSRPYIILFYAFFLILELQHLNLILFTIGFIFLYKLCNLLLINLGYLWFVSYGSCILWLFFNYRCFIYALEILSWPPCTKVRFTKWKLYLS